MSKEHEQINNVRAWGIEKGIFPFQTMYAKESEAKAFWWVMWSDPTKSDSGYRYFATDEQAAREWMAQADEMGLQTHIRTSASSGSSEALILPALLKTSEFARIHIMCHEAIHVWAKDLFDRLVLTRELSEALADYLGLRLMRMFFRETEPNKSLLASEYVGYQAAISYEVENMFISLMQNDRDQVLDHFQTWMGIGRKFNKIFRYPYDESGVKFDPYNITMVQEYRNYTALFFQVQDFFQRERIDLVDFLGDPEPYKSGLLELVHRME